MATGLCSKCVTVDKSSSQGGDRRERPWGGEVGPDFAKWPRAIVKAYMLKSSGLLYYRKGIHFEGQSAGGGPMVEGIQPPGCAQSV